MLHTVTRLAIAAPRRVIAAAFVVLAACAVFGVPVTDSLSGGGFRDPQSDSARASAILADTFDRPEMQLLLTVSAPDGAMSGAGAAAGAAIVAALERSPHVGYVQSPWGAPAGATDLVSTDGTTALVVAGLVGDESDAATHAQELSGALTRDTGGVIVRAGGSAAVNAQINEQTEKDLLAMESLAVPLSFLVLVWVFGGLFAAVLPMVVGALAITGSMAVLRGVAMVTDVSVFALNLAVAMGLALAIDYTLLILSRYRDEVTESGPGADALLRTMAAAGRTVVFSAVIVGLSMLPMALFPMYFLKSFAYAGVAVVAFASCAALVVTPAVITLAGSRLDALDVRRSLRRLLGRPEPEPRPVAASFWYRSTRAVTRRGAALSVGVVAVMLLLGAPFVDARWGFPDDRVLPAAADAHQVGDLLRTRFAADSATTVTVVLPDISGLPPTALGDYAAVLSEVPAVPWVSSPVGTYTAGRQTGPPVGPTGIAQGSAYLTVASTAALDSAASEAQLDALHDVPGPDGRDVLLTGTAPSNRDIVTAVVSRTPLVLSIIGLTSLVLLFMLTGSVVLPVKAVALNVLSLTAAFGALVWIFQQGHLGALGTTSTGTIGVTMPVLLFCIAFGLSMDYEVFLMARIREYWVAPPAAPAGTRAANDDAVALGLAHTGRVITAAAVIMSISFAALIAAEVSFMRMLGVGLTVAVLMDATLVRLVLVPAFMHVMGPANWWAPAPLRRLHARFGVTEAPSPGRHAPCAVPDQASGVETAQPG
ncbi:MMPL family transporter [Mycolicibacterium litorale]|uniref:Membrane protein n=1 Tax=Mycolicibacterium litorale TaxID=758802 RepID=A0AAD1ILG8_9MYCO|nr:MMPL family transporter [Mycolicibacterium litorale]MCV7418796.1 MMPL family transporter [Mycolicibacterium litorale]TDY00422.1 RND superfamily putative drug exporter [Mycolicibacterium litorale]BBY15742.1 membrane protein [Mycolicibacterium litorale]